VNKFWSTEETFCPKAKRSHWCIEFSKVSAEQNIAITSTLEPTTHLTTNRLNYPQRKIICTPITDPLHTIQWQVQSYKPITTEEFIRSLEVLLASPKRPQFFVNRDPYTQNELVLFTLILKKSRRGKSRIRTMVCNASPFRSRCWIHGLNNPWIKQFTD